MIMIIHLFVASAAIPATISPITVNFSGELTIVDDSLGQLDSSIVVGAPFSGSYSFDPDLAVDTYEPASAGAYSFDTTFGTQVGNSYFESDALDISVVAQGAAFPGQGYNASARSFVSEGLSINWMWIGLGTIETDVFEDDSLPLTLDLADFERTREFFLQGDDFVVRGELQSLDFVPEPTSASTLLFAIAFAAGKRRKLAI